MKIEFSRSIKYTPEFNGNKELPENEQLKADISIMEITDLLDLGDAFKQAKFEKGDLKDMKIEQQKTLVVNAAKYVCKYVKLTNNDGFSVDDVSKYPQFLQLSVELLFALLNGSKPNADDEKN